MMQHAGGPARGRGDVEAIVGDLREIVALIEIRSVFKDLDTTSNWPWEAVFFPHLLSALVLGGMLVLFYHLLPRRQARIEESELRDFVRFKSALAGILSLVFIALSCYAFATWTLDLFRFSDAPATDLNDAAAKAVAAVRG